MSGKHGRKRKGGGGGFYFKLSRISLMLILGMVVLECQAKPAEPNLGGTEAKVKDSTVDPAAVQETKVEVDNMISDTLSSWMQTRLKRDPTDPAAGTGPGQTSSASKSKVSSEDEGYADGKSCLDGKKPKTDGDLKREVDKNYPTATRSQINEYEQELNDAAQKQLGKNCKSKKCYVIPREWKVVCGSASESNQSSSSIQPITILIATLLGVAFLRMF